MLLNSFRYGLLRITEVFGKGAPINVSKTDIILHKWLLYQPNKDIPPSPKNSPFTIYKLAKTLVIDLQKDETDIFNDISKNTKAKIKRAMKEPFSFSFICSPTDKEIDEFAAFFNAFAKAKHIRPCHPERLKALRDKNGFMITKMERRNSPISYHGYLCDGQRAIMLYSASERIGLNSADQNEIGRANRYLHWKSILAFKEKGYSCYDFCGLFLDEKDKTEKGINHFKRGFGGCEVDEVKFVQGKSLIGKTIILLYHFLWRKDPEYLRAKKQSLQQIKYPKSL